MISPCQEPGKLAFDIGVSWASCGFLRSLNFLWKDPRGFSTWTPKLNILTKHPDLPFWKKIFFFFFFTMEEKKLGWLQKRNSIGCRTQQKCCSWLLCNLAGDVGNNHCAFLGNIPNFSLHHMIWVLGSYLHLSKAEAKIHPLTTASHTLCPLFPYGFLLFPALQISAWVYLCFQASHVFYIISATLWPLSPSLMLSFSVLLLCAAPCRVKVCHFKHCRQWCFCLLAAHSVLWGECLFWTARHLLSN